MKFITRLFSCFQMDLIGRIAFGSVMGLILLPVAEAKSWIFKGVPDPVEASFVAENNGYVVLKGSNDTSFEIPLANFNKSDQRYIELLEADDLKKVPISGVGEPVIRANDYQRKSTEKLSAQFIVPQATSELHLTGTDDPLAGSTVNFTEPDGWVFLDRVPPSRVVEKYLDQFLVNGRLAKLDENVRVVAYGSGAVVIPHGPEFPALRVFSSESLSGESLPFKPYVKYGKAELGTMADSAGSLILKRGYMATLARNEDGTGGSVNYVAQDHDVVVKDLPKELSEGINFVRVFPWRWTTKKGIAGGIHQNLKLGWFYDWNIGARSSLDLEYVAIRQKKHWPGMDQDWKAKGINHLLGFNEPDRPDQAKMTVDEAIQMWPVVLKTGLRVGSPATSDGGIGWLYEFMDKADRDGLRVDFVAVHYYRAVADPGDEKAAAGQLRDFLQRIHDRVKRPLWVTEWNNGANWTNAPDPNDRQQQAAVEAMIEMMDETPFVERYALYNWVEPSRELVRKDGSLSPAGEAYRDRDSPVFFVQPKNK